MIHFEFTIFFVKSLEHIFICTKRFNDSVQQVLEQI